MEGLHSNAGIFYIATGSGNFAELDLLQLYNVVDDPLEKNNLIQEEPVLAAEMEKDLLDYLEKVEGKTYRPLLSD